MLQGWRLGLSKPFKVALTEERRPGRGSTLAVLGTMKPWDTQGCGWRAKPRMDTLL